MAATGVPFGASGTGRPGEDPCERRSHPDAPASSRLGAPATMPGAWMAVPGCTGPAAKFFGQIIWSGRVEQNAEAGRDATRLTRSMAVIRRLPFDPRIENGQGTAIAPACGRPPSASTALWLLSQVVAARWRTSVCLRSQTAMNFSKVKSTGAGCRFHALARRLQVPLHPTVLHPCKSVGRYGCDSPPATHMRLGRSRLKVTRRSSLRLNGSGTWMPVAIG